MFTKALAAITGTSGIGVVERGNDANGTFLIVGVLLALLTVVLYGGVRLAWHWTRDVPYTEWVAVALGIVLVLAILAAIVSSYATGNVVLSVYLLVAPVVGVVLVSVATTLLGWTTFDSNPVWTFFLVTVAMAVLGVVAYGIGAGLRSFLG